MYIYIFYIYIYIYILADIKLIRKKAEKLIVKMHRCANNPVRFSTTKIGEYIPCGYSMSTILGFDHMENKHTLSLGKNCIKKFCTSLREHAKKKHTIDFENKKMLLLRKEELKSYQDLKVCSICREKSLKSLLKIKITEKSQIIVITQVNIEAEHIVFVIQNLTCVYKSLHFFITVQIIKELEFIIKELQNEFEEQFECLGENKEKWKTHKKGN